MSAFCFFFKNAEITAWLLGSKISLLIHHPTWLFKLTTCVTSHSSIMWYMIIPVLKKRSILLLIYIFWLQKKASMEPASLQLCSINICQYCVIRPSTAAVLCHLTWQQKRSYFIKCNFFFFKKWETCKLGQMVRFAHRGPQILPPRAQTTREISNVEWNKHCSHTHTHTHTLLK